ncbi:hypothetical protein HYU11_05725 [Candidatus Woesearchaeota archaeon]|nr:hypothetical protein [Candidatus Woesearchaeota archaeon]
MAKNAELEAVVIKALVEYMRSEGFKILGERNRATNNDAATLIRKNGSSLVDQPDEYRFHYMGYVCVGHTGKIRGMSVRPDQVLRDGMDGNDKYGWYLFAADQENMFSTYLSP